MATSIRHFFKAHAGGRTDQNININGLDITRRSAFAVTAAPCDLGTGFLDPDVRLNVHGPNISVTNVVPHGPEGASGGVEFALNIDSREPVDVAVTITVFEPWESFGSG